MSRYARVFSQHIDARKVESYIFEAENVNVRPTLGDEMYLAIVKNPTKFSTLLNGGEYTDNSGCAKVFVGLYSAISYYAYARLLKNIDVNVSRFGVTYKDDENSSRLTMAEKMMHYNDASAIADKYMQECIHYIHQVPELARLYKGAAKVVATRTHYRIIGD